MASLYAPSYRLRGATLEPYRVLDNRVRLPAAAGPKLDGKEQDGIYKTRFGKDRAGVGATLQGVCREEDRLEVRGRSDWRHHLQLQSDRQPRPGSHHQGVCRDRAGRVRADVEPLRSLGGRASDAGVRPRRRWRWGRPNGAGPSGATGGGTSW